MRRYSQRVLCTDIRMSLEDFASGQTQILFYSLSIKVIASITIADVVLSNAYEIQKCHVPLASIAMRVAYDEPFGPMIFGWQD